MTLEELRALADASANYGLIELAPSRLRDPYEKALDPRRVLAIIDTLIAAREALQRVVAAQNVAGPNSLHNAGNFARGAIAAIEELEADD
jgi:hypothetical protein